MSSVLIGSLTRAQREEMFNLHAVYVDQEALEADFYRKSVPVKQLDLTVIDTNLLYPMNDDDIQQYACILDDPSLKYPVVANNQLIDGLHRITAAIKKGYRTLDVLDFGTLLKPEESGSQFIITLRHQKNLTPF